MTPALTKISRAQSAIHNDKNPTRNAPSYLVCIIPTASHNKNNGHVYAPHAFRLFIDLAVAADSFRRSLLRALRLPEASPLGEVLLVIKLNRCVVREKGGEMTRRRERRGERGRWLGKHVYPEGTTNKLISAKGITAPKKYTICRRGGGGGVGGGVYSILMHGRSPMAIDPGIPTLPGRSMSGFHRPGRHCLHQAQSAVSCSASRMKGELHPTKNRW